MSDIEDNFNDEYFSEVEDEVEEDFIDEEDEDEKNIELENEEKVDEDVENENEVIDEDEIIIDDENEEDIENIIELEKEMNKTYKRNDVKSKISIPILTKYEKAKIIGLRAIHISKGAKILVDYTGIIDPIEIAEKELKEKVIPLIIRRYLPNGLYEDWKIKEFKNV